MPAIADVAFNIRQVSYAYDRISALNNVTFSVPRGQRVALLGANGSGKSTLLRLLAGLSFADLGSVSYFGEDLTEDRLRQDSFFFPFRQNVGVVFQDPDVQLFNATVFDEVAFGPLQMRWPKDKIRDAVERVLATMDIAALRDRPPHRLSGGEKKRVALASVLVLDPGVLILDEPTAALDPNSQNTIVELLSSWRSGLKTVVTATHDLDTLEDIADHCLVLIDGSLVGAGEPMSVLHDIELLERARLVRRLHHVHPSDSPGALPHAHLHKQD